MMKNDEKMIKQYINQYEYDIDHEFDVNSVDDIKDEIIKQEIESPLQINWWICERKTEIKSSI